MSTETADKTTELDVLKEILRWVRFSGMREVRNLLTTVLNDNQKLYVYQLSDGSRGTAEVAASAGLGTETVRRLWIAWLRLGIGDSIPVRGGDRFKHAFDLEELGIDYTVPTRPAPTPESSEKTASQT